MNSIDPALRASTRDGSPDAARIMADPRFQELVGKRFRFAWTLSAAMLVIYLGFVLLAAFAKPLMATTPFGGVTSLGIVLGLLVIIAAFVLTGLYVRRANRDFDPLTDALRGSKR